MSRANCALCRLLPLLCALWVLLAQEATALAQRSELEQSVVQEALEHFGFEPEPAPEGKWVEEIEIYALDVFDDRDPVPNFLNIFHATSHEGVIRRELLFGVGDRYHQRRIDESARNLRALRQLSLVVIVPARGSRPDRVRVVAVVKDVWSLRLNTNFAAGAGALDYLLVNPSEENLAGTHTSVGLLYLLQRDTQSFGARFIYPRIAGSRLRTAAQVTLAFNRFTGAGEGSSGQFLFERPLFSQFTSWAFATRVAWYQAITRRYLGGEIRNFGVEVAPGVVEEIPEVYDTDRLAGEYRITRSYGHSLKMDLTGGIEADRRRYRTQDLSGFSPDAIRAFETEVLPVSDVRISPFVQLHSYRTDFLRTWNLEVLSLQEDYRLGHDALLRVYPASSALGSTRTLLGVLATLGYTVPLGDGLARGVVSSDIVVANESRNDALIWLQGRVATPSFAFGRLLLDGLVADRYQDYLNSPPFVLGGNNRLRGYLADEFQGRDVAVFNAEWRTRSVDILSAQIGAAAFYDVGDTPDSLDDLELRQGAGIGLRLLFPQADRIVVRVDWGLPLSGDRDVLPGTVFATFGQAFAMPLVVEPSVTTALSPF